MSETWHVLLILVVVVGLASILLVGGYAILEDLRRAARNNDKHR